MTPGNVHDSHRLQPLVEKVLERVKNPLAVATDAAYKTPAITNFLSIREPDVTCPPLHASKNERWFLPKT
ncbi:hypothetical protein [Bacillus cereus]|uniref:hypothetical protein n=1 Tax=Bacillus cereus TaxID=1396 RepID=UPI00366C85AC